MESEQLKELFCFPPVTEHAALTPLDSLFHVHFNLEYLDILSLFSLQQTTYKQHIISDYNVLHKMKCRPVSLTGFCLLLSGLSFSHQGLFLHLSRMLAVKVRHTNVRHIFRTEGNPNILLLFLFIYNVAFSGFKEALINIKIKIHHRIKIFFLPQCCICLDCTFTVYFPSSCRDFFFLVI